MKNKTKKTHRIHHHYAVENFGDTYVESEIERSSLADIVIGLQFYIEDNTKYGESTCISEEMAMIFLCEFYNCKECNYNIISPHDSYGDEKIDLYFDYEDRSGPDYKKYIKLIKPYVETELVKKICAFYNDDSAFEKSPYEILSVKEIIEKY